MIIRLTQKLAKKIKVVPATAAPRAENPFVDWTANLFAVGRVQYIILTNSASLYSVVFPGRGINDPDKFAEHVLSALGEQMADAGYGGIFEEHIAPLAGSILFSKTGDRRVLGSMNELILQAKYHLADQTLAEGVKGLNETLMGALGYQYPREALTKLAGLPETVESGSGKILPFPGGQDGEKEMPAMLEQVRKPTSKEQLLDEAQNLIYDAWESSPSRAVKLARQALEISPDCADAYVLLADLAAATTRERIELLRQGVAAGSRALGKRFFKENIGHFWGMLESRPFMRAMVALAMLYWEIGQGDEAIELWREMLRLNPNDNLGVRYLLLSCLLELNREEEAKELLRCYAGDFSADWSYGEALLAFRAEGDTPSSRRKLSAAQKHNPHILPYLLGLKKIPKRQPEYISLGDETEAISYVARNLAGWAKTPGALEWLKGQEHL